MTEERRQVIRLPVSLDARWQGLLGRHRAKVNNFSAVGCYLETSGQALNHEVLEVELKTPGNRWIRLRGQVIYRIPEGGLGVFFVEMSDETQTAVAALVEQYSADVPKK